MPLVLSNVYRRAVNMDEPVLIIHHGPQVVTHPLRPPLPGLAAKLVYAVFARPYFVCLLKSQMQVVRVNDALPPASIDLVKRITCVLRERISNPLDGD